MPKMHFSKLAHNLCFRSVWRTCRMWWRCFSQVWLKIRMSSKYTTTNELVNGHNMSSVSLMKVVGEFVNLKDMTNHSKINSLTLKEVFDTSDGSIGTWWYPKFKSILLKYFTPFELVQKVINPWDQVPIPNDDLVQRLIVNTESPSPILLMH